MGSEMCIRDRGHTVIGTGYAARIVIDRRVQNHTQNHNATAQNHNEGVVVDDGAPVDNPPVDNHGIEGLEPPSLTWVEEEGKLKVDGGSNYTSPASRNGRVPTQRSSKNSGSGTGRHALQVAKDIRIARQVRPW